MKEIADLKEYLTNKIDDLRKQIEENQKELDLLTNIMKKVDSLLIQHSFTPAKELYNKINKEKAQSIETKPKPSEDRVTTLVEEESIKFEDVVLATVKSSESNIFINLTDKMVMTGEEPPFRSFIMNKILNELRNEDKQLVQANKLKQEDICSINSKYYRDVIEKIYVMNYRTNKRKEKIIKAIAWSLRTIYQGK